MGMGPILCLMELPLQTTGTLRFGSWSKIIVVRANLVPLSLGVTLSYSSLLLGGKILSSSIIWGQRSYDVETFLPHFIYNHRFVMPMESFLIPLSSSQNLLFACAFLRRFHPGNDLVLFLDHSQSRYPPIIYKSPAYLEVGKRKTYDMH